MNFQSLRSRYDFPLLITHSPVNTFWPVHKKHQGLKLFLQQSQQKVGIEKAEELMYNYRGLNRRLVGVNNFNWQLQTCTGYELLSGNTGNERQGEATFTNMLGGRKHLTFAERNPCYPSHKIGLSCSQEYSFWNCIDLLDRIFNWLWELIGGWEQESRCEVYNSEIIWRLSGTVLQNNKLTD